jgi:two-component system sensor histidine kinase KdpD
MDSVLIEQALVNLLENAIKYSPAGTPIELSASNTEDAVTIEIADRGPGIPVGMEEKIFDKFYRASPNSMTGVGLGLTICKGIVEAHGGHIMAKNRPGGGALFSFTLPLDGKQPELSEEV